MTSTSHRKVSVLSPSPNLRVLQEVGVDWDAKYHLHVMREEIPLHRGDVPATYFMVY